jgi:hypothetical protein
MEELVDGAAVIACEVEMAVGQIAWPSFTAGVGLVPTWRRQWRAAEVEVADLVLQAADRIVSYGPMIFESAR